MNNMTVIVNTKVLSKDSYKEPTDGRFDDCTCEILKNSGQKTVVTGRVMKWKITDGQNQTKKLQKMKLKHVGITVIKQQFEFHYKLILYTIKLRDFNLRVSYISRILKIAKIAKFSTREI